MLLLACSIVVTGVHLANGTASGADSYGYVSEAELWLNGELRIEQPWVRELPWPNREWTATPLGYSPVGDGSGTITPNYSPGLPFLMAGAKWVGGQTAVYWLVPLFGGLFVYATYATGRRLAGEGVGAGAAVLVATSPAVLFFLCWPMTDVPVAALYAAATWAMLSEAAAGTVAAGLITGLAIFVRPNTVFIGALFGLWQLWRGRRQAMLFALGVAPGIGGVAAFNWTVYGSPLMSGYGSLSDNLELGRFGENLRNYTRSFVTSQTAFALLGLAALLVPLPIVWGSGARARRALVLTAVTLGTLACFLFYLPFTEWWYLRFLLPIWPGLFIALVWLLVRVVPKTLWPVVAVVVLVLAVRDVGFARREHVAGLHVHERRAIVAAQLVKTTTPPNSVIFAMQHGGSVRYYGERMTLRWDNFPPEAFQSALAWLNDHGAHPYALLDDWEVPEFKKRLSETGAAGALDARTVFELTSPGHVYLFDLTAPASLQWTRVSLSETERPRLGVPPAAPPALMLRPPSP
jgi:hypothetical protein